MRIDGNLNGLIVYLTSSSGNFTLKSFIFNSRSITQTYNVAPENIIKNINFATFIWNKIKYLQEFNLLELNKKVFFIYELMHHVLLIINSLVN